MRWRGAAWGQRIRRAGRVGSGRRSASHGKVEHGLFGAGNRPGRFADGSSGSMKPPLTSSNGYRMTYDTHGAVMYPERRPSNTLGIVGFVLAFCLPPIGLILSLAALARRPRGFAIAGVIIGLLGSVM